MTNRKTIRFSFAALMLLALLGCPSSSKSPPADPGTGENPEVVLPDGEGEVPDTSEVAPPQDGVEADNPPPDVIPDVTQEVDPGPDKTPPEVVKTSPAKDDILVKIPFEIRVTFNEPVWSNTVNKDSFKVADVNGQVVAGTYSTDVDDTVAVFKPGQVVLRYSSPYKVTLTNQIKDKGGNGLKEWYNFSFSTEPPPKMDGYAALAAKYAPLIRQAIMTGVPQYDYITAFDFDGDIDCMNNWDSIKKALSVPSVVYYDVVETKSHIFIRYGFFHAFRFGVGNKGQLGNDVSGSTVVIAKFPAETPLAVLTYFSDDKEHEHVRSYVTEESGLVPAGKDKIKQGVNWVFKAADLFGTDGRYQAFVTAQTHESCLWIHTSKEDPADQWCILTDDIKKKLNLATYSYKDGTAGAIKKTESGFPTVVDGVSYGLEPILTDWWSRRDHKGEHSIFFSEFDYEYPPMRPDVLETSLPAQFQDPVSSTSGFKGRPPWAWKWIAPTVPLGFFVYEMPRGAYFIDPAYFFMMRHKLTATFDPKTKTGYSDQYCFNPYVAIDVRETDADCKTN